MYEAQRLAVWTCWIASELRPFFGFAAGYGRKVALYLVVLVVAVAAFAISSVLLNSLLEKQFTPHSTGMEGLETCATGGVLVASIVLGLIMALIGAAFRRH